jgi:phosphatidate phosphatase APP1
MISSVAGLFCVLLAASGASAADTKADEDVVFFPTVGYPVSEGREWALEIHGRIFERQSNQVALAILRRALAGELEQEGAEAEAIFARRARAFLADNERSKEISIRLDAAEHFVGKSELNGHFSGTVRLPTETVDRLRKQSDGTAITFQAVTRDGDGRVLSGTVHLLTERGVSVISDIDDTIKVTEVRDRKAALRNTFFRPFKPVAGMAAVYQRWARDPGAQFHYVSASPWQLFEPLEGFVRNNSFPGGSFHLKQFRLKDSSFFDVFKTPEAYKLGVIELLMKRFPQRHFVLVGDSGERDPEIYGELARKFPGQVRRIFIRDVTDEGRDAERYEQAFREVPPESWTIFREPTEISGALH